MVKIIIYTIEEYKCSNTDNERKEKCFEVDFIDLHIRSLWELGKYFLLFDWFL